MKIIQFLVFVILFFGCSTDDSTAVEVEVISATADIQSEIVNIFYVGINNPIKVSANNINNELIVEVTGEGNSIEKINDNEFNVKVTNPFNTIEVKIYDGLELIKSEVFKVQMIPDPLVRLGNNSSESIGG